MLYSQIVPQIVLDLVSSQPQQFDVAFRGIFADILRETNLSSGVWNVMFDAIQFVYHVYTNSLLLSVGPHCYQQLLECKSGDG